MFLQWRRARQALSQSPSMISRLTLHPTSNSQRMRTTMWKRVKKKATPNPNLDVAIAKELESRYIGSDSLRRTLTHDMQGEENPPWFDYCTHTGLKREWPEIQSNQVDILIQKPTRKSLILTKPRSPSPVSTVEDFRLFNHFIQTAFPHYPVGNDSIWQHEIPSIASDVS